MVMFQVIDKFSHDFIRSAFKFEKVKTDTIVFRLHYKLSVWLVVLYSVCYMYVALSTPISCISSHKGDNGLGAFRKEVSDYCWVHGTYVVENLDPALELFPGIGGVTPGNHDIIRYHHYYKWMYFYMVLMIIILHIPRQFWRSVESGRLNSLVNNLKCMILFENDEMEKDQDNLVEYMHCHLGYHRRYALGFVFGEFLNIVVSGLLMYLWDVITEHEFSVNGATSLEFMQTPPSFRTDRLAKVFPILGKCNFKTYGPSGGIETHDFICVLPLNLINERAAIFFWYYFMFLVTVGITAFIFRVVIMTSKRLRISLLSGLAPLTSKEDLVLLMERCSYSDWFMIYQIGSTLEPVMFRQFMQKFLLKIRDTPKI